MWLVNYLVPLKVANSSTPLEPLLVSVLRLYRLSFAQTSTPALLLIVRLTGDFIAWIRVPRKYIAVPHTRYMDVFEQ